MTKCDVCGGDIYPGIELIGAGLHSDSDYCITVLLARVEAAEKRLEAVLDLARRVNYEANQQHKAKLDADLRVCWLESWLISLGIDPDSAPGKEE